MSNLTKEQIEKAREIYNRFITIDGVADLVLPHTIAKEAALIYCDGMIEEHKKVIEISVSRNNIAQERLAHWQSVKQAIQQV